MTKLSWVHIATLALLTSCGGESFKSTDKFESGETQTDPGAADANKKGKGKPKAPAPEAETPAVVEHEELDCSGIMMHDGQETCDADDVAVADGTAGTGAETPPAAEEPVAEEPAVEKPVEPAKPVTPAPAPALPPKDPNIVEFRIKAGTGTAPWNTAAEMVNVKVGQTLRIFNDDTVVHRLHTGGAPCPHGVNFAPGASFDCVVTRALDPAATPGRTYDHIAGTTALFFLKSVP